MQIAQRGTCVSENLQPMKITRCILSWVQDELLEGHTVDELQDQSKIATLYVHTCAVQIHNVGMAQAPHNAELIAERQEMGTTTHTI